MSRAAPRPRPRGSAIRLLEAYGAAKVNLGWRVGPKRDDGYHEVSGLVQTVSLADRLVVRGEEPTDEETVVEVRGVPLGVSVDGPQASGDLGGPDDLVCAAARVLAERVKPRPTRIRVTKRIPVGAGLGGGSADAAAALAGLTVAWGAQVSAADLVRLGAEVGSDVPAIVRGGLVAVSGRGERVGAAGSPSGFRFVCGISPGRLAAGDVYARLDELRAERRHAGHVLSVDGFPHRDELFANDLEAAALSLDPGLEHGLAAMRRAGAPVAFVAGSGPTVVGVVPDPSEAEGVAERTKDAFVRTVVCEPVGWGVRVVVR